MPNADDSFLVSRCIEGNSVAWGRFVKRYGSLILWVIKNRLRRWGYPCQKHTVEDIFQEVFILLWEEGKLKQIKDRKRILPWLTMVTANCAHNYLRSKKEELVEEKFWDNYKDSRQSEQEKHHDIVEELFKQLAPREIIILKLSYFYNKTHREIGSILRMPPNTISSIVKRVRERLEEKLKL